MANSLSGRVGRVIAASANALVSRLENQAPAALMEQAIREVDGIIGEVRRELGQVSANRHLAQQQHAHLSTQHDTLSGQARQALREEREDLASTAVARQLDIEAQLPVLETSLAELARKEEELSGYVAALLSKKREMEQALHEFRRSRDGAGKHNLPAQSAQGVAGDQQQRLDSATGAFDRLYQHHAGLTPSAAGSSLAQAASLKELDDLVRNNKISERLAQLRSQSMERLEKSV